MILQKDKSNDRNPKLPKPKKTSRVKVSQGRKSNPSLSREKELDLERSTQIQGFAKAIHCWLSRIGLHRPIELLARHLDASMTQIPLEGMPKFFKLLLTASFSKLMKQELPEGHEQVSEIWPWPNTSSFRGCINAYMTRSYRRKRACWGLLQCKVLSATVPFGFKLQAYEKHAEALSEVRSTDERTLEEFRNFIQPWISKIREHYSPKTKMAGLKACYNGKRVNGGLKAKLLPKVRYRGHLSVPNRPIRMEPVVISIVGDPGVGKSRAFRSITANIAERFGKCLKEPSGYAYWRSIATDHWDGYNNQLFAGIDDFGGQTHYNDADEISPEKLELLQTVSTVDCVLPMADLKAKGRKFTSEFLGLSMNMRALRCNSRFADPGAFWRRIAKPIWVMQKVTKTECNLFQVEFGLSDDREGLESHTDLILDEDMRRALDEMGYMRDTSSPVYVPFCRAKYLRIHKSKVPKIISDWALSTWEEKNDEERHLCHTRFQPFSSCEEFETGFGYEFDIPSELPTNKVSVMGLCEPLKVRMITKPQPLAWALKPLQLAMFRALKSWQCFEPCWNPNFDPSRILNPRTQKGLLLLSGDYSAATDGLHMDVSQVAIEEIADMFESIDPQIARLVRWEGGVHELVYPILKYIENGKKKQVELPNVVQSNGQLMGSLLSFPILCLVNAFTYGKSHGLDLNQLGRVLIHGDDICFQSDPDSIQRWKDVAHSVGLEPSVGKNYSDKNWVSIDSKLFIRKGKKLEEVQTGKFKCLVRTAGQSDTFFEALRSGFTPRNIRYYSKDRLVQTPRSLDIPVDYGGLGDTFRTEKDTIKDRLIYVFEKRKRCRVVPTKQTAKGLKILQVPAFAAKELKLHTVQLHVEHEQLEWQEEIEGEQPLGAQAFPHREFQSFQKWVYKPENEHFYECVTRCDLRRERPLSLFRTVTVVVKSDFQFARLTNLVEKEYSMFHSIGNKSNARVRLVNSLLKSGATSHPPIRRKVSFEPSYPGVSSTVPVRKQTFRSPLLISNEPPSNEDREPSRFERWSNPLHYGSSLSLYQEFGPH